MQEQNFTEEKPLHRLRTFLILFSLLSSLIYCWSCRFSMTSDGISYIDMANEALNGNWKAIINPLWSPLYPILLSLLFFLFRPNNFWEFPVVHMGNYIVFIFSLFSFGFFLSELFKHIDFVSKKENPPLITIPKKEFLLLSYVIFLQSVLNFIDLWSVSPDLLLSVFVFLASGLLLYIYRNGHSFFIHVLLGLVLGIGYLAKAAMFPISFLFLLILFFSRFTLKEKIVKIFLSLVVFLLISLPLIFSLSNMKGYLTFGESGKINYAWYVNDTPFFAHWQGEKPGKGKPIHPTRKIYNFPPVYEFSTPVLGTYPPWFDPTYWYEGVEAKFNFYRQLCALAASLTVFIKIFIERQIALVFCFFVLLYMSGRKKEIISDVKKYSFLLLPALFSFFMFSLVHIEDRYIAPFVVIFWLALFSSLRMINTEFNRRLIKHIAVVMIFMLTFMMTAETIREIYNWNKNASVHIEWEIAEKLKNLGLKAKDKVGIIGYEIPISPYWAQVGKFKIVSEILKKNSKDFWSVSHSEREQILQVFKSTGAKAVIAKDPPRNCINFGWKEISTFRKSKLDFLTFEKKGVYVYLL